VLAASYPARAYGIRSGMPGIRARRLCPGAVVVTADFDEIATVSSAVMEMFRSITPLVEPLSSDEAFLDVSGALRRFSSPARIGEYLRARVADEQRITCSVGVAATTQLAKLASRRAKPDGLVVVPRDEMTAFLHPLAVDELWGVGEKTAAALHRLGLRTVGDLAHTRVELLQRAFGPVAGRHLHTLAWGGDDRGVTPRRSLEEPERSMGHSETFSRDVDDPDVILRELLRLSTRLTARMRAAHVSGRTVTLTVRFHDFTTITRARTLRDATCSTSEIYPTAVDLFVALGLERARIRLVGVRVEGLLDTSGTARQLRLGERPHGWDDAEHAVDQVTTRFGTSAVRPATLVSNRRP
jgi:DNA polymerase-4